MNSDKPLMLVARLSRSRRLDRKTSEAIEQFKASGGEVKFAYLDEPKKLLGQHEPVAIDLDTICIDEVTKFDTLAWEVIKKRMEAKREQPG